MLPLDIMRVTASASARVLARAIDDGFALDQVAALLSIVSTNVELIKASGTKHLDAVRLDLVPPAGPFHNVVSLADRRARNTRR